MRLSAWARKTGLSHKTARRLWKTGRLPFLPAEQLATGTVIVHERSPDFELKAKKLPL